MNALIERQVLEILEDKRYYNGAAVGDIEPCHRCGLYSLVCLTDDEDELGIHTWTFECSECGATDYERW